MFEKLAAKDKNLILLSIAIVLWLIAYVSTEFMGFLGFILIVSVLLPLCCIQCLGMYIESPRNVAILFGLFTIYAVSMNIGFFAGNVEYIQEWGLKTYPCFYRFPEGFNGTYGCDPGFSGACIFGTTDYDCHKSYSDMDNITSGYQNCSTIDYNGKPPSDYNKWWCPYGASLEDNETPQEAMANLLETYDQYYSEAVFVGILWSFGFVIYCGAVFYLFLSKKIGQVYHAADSVDEGL